MCSLLLLRLQITPAWKAHLPADEDLRREHRGLVHVSHRAIVLLSGTMKYGLKRRFQPQNLRPALWKLGILLMFQNFKRENHNQTNESKELLFAKIFIYQCIHYCGNCQMFMILNPWQDLQTCLFYLCHTPYFIPTRPKHLKVDRVLVHSVWKAHGVTQRKNNRLLSWKLPRSTAKGERIFQV